MKNFLALILISCVFLLATETKAQTTAGYFTESEVGYNVESNQDGYIYGRTATAVGVGDSVQYIASKVIGYKSATSQNPRNFFSGAKAMFGIQVTVAFENVASTLLLEGSADGTNWVTVATLDSDCDPQTTQTQWYLADLTSVYMPYYRMKFNSNTLEVETAGRVKFLYCLPK